MVRRTIKKTIFKYGFLFNLYYRYIWTPKDEMSKYLDNISRGNRLFFIQVGSNDGLYNDPIYKFVRRDKWTGILIEPQSNIFSRLKANYKGVENIYFENSAIGKKTEQKIMYKIAFTDSDWASGISSFSKESLLKNIESGYIDRKAKENNIRLPKSKSEYIGTEIVNCLSFSDLLSKYEVKNNIDILVIDTEEYDYEVIKSINFDKILPRCILYEHAGMLPPDKQACENYLKEIGYRCINFNSDTIAELQK